LKKKKGFAYQSEEKKEKKEKKRPSEEKRAVAFFSKRKKKKGGGPSLASGGGRDSFAWKKEKLSGKRDTDKRSRFGSQKKESFLPGRGRRPEGELRRGLEKHPSIWGGEEVTVQLPRIRRKKNGEKKRSPARPGGGTKERGGKNPYEKRSYLGVQGRSASEKILGGK